MALDLNEKIGIHFTREEWAVILIGLAHVSHGPKIDAIAEKLTSNVQGCAAPVGVLVRTLAKNGNG
jgi:hypothetical protein